MRFFLRCFSVVKNLTTLDATSSGGGGTSIKIAECDHILSDAALGDSISVNGACLTITELQKPLTFVQQDSSQFNHTSDRNVVDTEARPPFFKVGCAPETLRRTNLGSLTQGSKVNLERSVMASSRMGGHFVQGHVDTTATIRKMISDGNSLVVRLEPKNQRVLRYIVEKGYVTIDGASLTVTKVVDAEDRSQDQGEDENKVGNEGWFEIMLIAYTQEKVVTATKKIGDDANLEIDMVGKYVEKSVQGYFEDRFQGTESGTSGIERSAILEKMVDRIMQEKLAKMAP